VKGIGRERSVATRLRQRPGDDQLTLHGMLYRRPACTLDLFEDMLRPRPIFLDVMPNFAAISSFRIRSRLKNCQLLATHL
jgi:hypothetical protein